MTVSNSKYIQLHRLRQWCNLFFFAIIALHACREKQTSGISIVWDEQKAKGIHIPAALLKEQDADSAKAYLTITRAGNNTAILGHYYKDDGIVFEPLLPFASGTVYEIRYRNERIDTFSIPKNEVSTAPELLSIYPQQDTLPVNILKLYFEFSKPMRENVSDQFIHLIKNGTDTLRDVFLNLQPELWNEKRTVLTIWFDPGRIKRDLQPNQKMGAPLEENTRYTIAVSSTWKDAEGIALKKSFSKVFFAGKRDSLSPEPLLWIIQPPKTNTADPLIISPGEPLDHFLLEETVHITDAKGNLLKGRIVTDKKDSQLHFIPSVNWQQGEYQLRIDAKLEDHAGNNLNKPFDRDMASTNARDNAFYYRTFHIK